MQSAGSDDDQVGNSGDVLRATGQSSDLATLWIFFSIIMNHM